MSHIEGISDSLKQIAQFPLCLISLLSSLTYSNSDLQHSYEKRNHNPPRLKNNSNLFFRGLTTRTTIPFCFLIASMPLTAFYLASADPSSVFWSAASPGVTGLAAYSWKWTAILLRGHFASRSGGERRKP